MAEKLEMMSDDIIQENIDFIASRFPNALKECKDDKGNLVKRIDFDILKQELSNVIIDDKKERYQMTWPDKKKSILLANSRINGTLRPVKEKSVDFENTQNLYIEGDNLDVLKLLRETYLGKVKMIYIDPPYNTGNDFVYEDDFAQSSEEYLSKSGQYDEQGNRLVTNSESNGRFHTDWLNMMYPRLKVARDLLTDDGVIFISIDDNEYDNLKKICDEIFGNNSYCGTFIQNKGNAQNDAHNMQKNHEYILCYFKDGSNNYKNVLVSKEVEEKEVYKDKIGFYYKGSGIVTGGDGGTLNKRPNLGYTIYFNEETNDSVAVQDYDVEKAKISNDENIVYSDNNELIKKGYITIRAPKKGQKLGCWTWSIDKFNVERNYILISKTKNGYSICKKVYITSEVYEKNGKYYAKILKFSPSRSILNYSTSSGSSLVNDLIGMKAFDNPKNIDMISYLINLLDDKNLLILDFFSGSATTAHAIINLNYQDGGNRKYIMVQLPELYKGDDVNNFDTICDIGEERIRRAGKKIKDELIEKKNKAGLLADDVMDPESLDIGFRVLKLDSSNMNDVYYNPSALSQSLLDNTIDNIKPDRTSLDLLFQVMLELGIELFAKITEKEINGKKYYQVNDNDIVACFDDNLDNDLLIEIAKLQPLYAVFKDSSFATDSVGINNEQIFKTYSPQTKIKVL